MEQKITPMPHQKSTTTGDDLLTSIRHLLSQEVHVIEEKAKSASTRVLKASAGVVIAAISGMLGVLILLAAIGFLIYNETELPVQTVLFIVSALCLVVAAVAIPKKKKEHDKVEHHHHQKAA